MILFSIINIQIFSNKFLKVFNKYQIKIITIEIEPLINNQMNNIIYVIIPGY